MNLIPCLVIVAWLGVEPAPLSEAEVLAGASERIQKVRTAEVELKILLPSEARGETTCQVHIAQTRHAFLFGCNIFKLGKCRTPEDNEAYAQKFGALLNYATLPFYWWTYEPKRGEPNYQDTARILEWCQAHQVTPKGHPLAWNFRDPTWLGSASDRAMAMQLKRITDCMGRFHKQIDLWDVVNEATDYDRDQCKQQAPILTAAIEKIGVDEYVRQAFQAARKANPSATLIINDYRLDPAFETRVIQKLVDEDGKPLYDIIGLQSHQHGGAIPIPKVWEVCDRLAKYGKPLHWTETTFLSGEQGWDLIQKRKDFKWPSTPEGEQRQAEQATKFYTVLFSHPAVEAITWWDFSDQDAFQDAPAGLLRADMTPKPAYDALHRLIKGEWWTVKNLEVPADGRVKFRGFLGDYRVLRRGPGRPCVGTFTLKKDQSGPLTVRLREAGEATPGAYGRDH